MIVDIFLRVNHVITINLSSCNFFNIIIILKKIQLGNIDVDVDMITDLANLSKISKKQNVAASAQWIIKEKIVTSCQFNCLRSLSSVCTVL